MKHYNLVIIFSLLVTEREEEDYHTTHTTAPPPTFSEDNKIVSSQDDDEDDIEPNCPLRKYSINALSYTLMRKKKQKIIKYCVCIPSSFDHFLSIRDTAVVYVFTL